MATNLFPSFRDFNHINTVKANGSDTSNWNNATPSQNDLIAGDYVKGHIDFCGLDISIENPAGSVCSGDDWLITMYNHYGYIENTLGADGDELDVYVGEVQFDSSVTIIDQYIDNVYDETKIMLGFPDEFTSLANYKQNYDLSTWDVSPHIVNTVPLNMLFEWLNNGDTTQPFYIFKRDYYEV